MYRPPKLIAIACIAVVLLTAATPAIWESLLVILEPIDELFAVVVVVEDDFPPEDVRPFLGPFLDSLDSRGPPVL